jgi:hypothetical protein
LVNSHVHRASINQGKELHLVWVSARLLTTMIQETMMRVTRIPTPFARFLRLIQTV